MSSFTINKYLLYWSSANFSCKASKKATLRYWVNAKKKKIGKKSRERSERIWINNEYIQTKQAFTEPCRNFIAIMVSEKPQAQTCGLNRCHHYLQHHVQLFLSSIFCMGLENKRSPGTISPGSWKQALSEPCHQRFSSPLYKIFASYSRDCPPLACPSAVAWLFDHGADQHCHLDVRTEG